MTWTTEKPTQIGYYWYRRLVQKTIYTSIVRVRAFKHAPRGFYIYAAKDVKRCYGLWAGPLKEPA